MPYVRIEITDGATAEQKLELYKGVTDLLVKVLNKNPEYTFVVIEEVAGENWGHKGTSVAEIRKAEAKARGGAAKATVAKPLPKAKSAPAKPVAVKTVAAATTAAKAPASKAPAKAKPKRA